MTHIMKRLLVLRMMDCGLDGDNLRNLFKNLQEGVNLSKKTLEHIEKSLDNPVEGERVFEICPDDSLYKRI